MNKAIVLGARRGSGNIGNAIVEALVGQRWDVIADDCRVGDGTRPPGGNLPDDETAERHGYAPTDKGRYSRFEVPSFDWFKRHDADALVVTLGSTYKDPFWEVEQHVMDRVLRASLLMPLEAARRYVQSGGERQDWQAPPGERYIIFIGSYAWRHPFTNGTAYCAAKAGLDAAASTLGWELTDKGYRVHVVHPHHVPGTPMWQEVERGVMESKGWTREQAMEYAARDLKMPDHLTPGEVADVVRILLEEPSMSWLSGTRIELNGGTR